jgi:hypothetical protein
LPVTRQVPPVEKDEREEVPAPNPGQPRADALFSRLRRRVQGRVQDDVRHRINLAAARTEDDLLEAHIQNARLFIDTLESEQDEAEAIELYLETMMLPDGVGDVIYHRALRLIADEVLPPLPPASSASSREFGAAQRTELAAEEVGP